MKHFLFENTYHNTSARSKYSLEDFCRYYARYPKRSGLRLSKKEKSIQRSKKRLIKLLCADKNCLCGKFENNIEHYYRINIKYYKANLDKALYMDEFFKTSLGAKL